MKEMDLIRLIEECGEVIQAATKMLRFGAIGQYDDGRSNKEVLTSEIGDLKACIQMLSLSHSEIDMARLKKLQKLDRIAPYELGFDTNLTREEREDLHKQGKALDLLLAVGDQPSGD